MLTTESQVHELVRIVDRRFRVDGGLEISVLVQEVRKRLFGHRNAGGIVGIFIGEIGYLQKANVREALNRAWKFDYAEVERRFQKKADAEAGDVRHDFDLNVGKVAGLFQCRGSLLDFFFRVGRVCRLFDQPIKRGQIAMRIRDQRNGTHILSCVGSLRSLRGELGEKHGCANQPKYGE